MITPPPDTKICPPLILLTTTTLLRFLQVKYFEISQAGLVEQALDRPVDSRWMRLVMR